MTEETKNLDFSAGHGETTVDLGPESPIVNIRSVPKTDAKKDVCVPDPGYVPPPAVHAHSCSVCQGAFGYFSKRHNCRNCGNAFCGAHANKHVTLWKYNLRHALVCDTCYPLVKDEKGWKQDPDTLLPAWKDGYYNAVTAPDGETEIRHSKKGIASKAPITVMEVFKKAVARNPDWIALRVERKGEWKEWSFKQYADDVYTAAKALIKLGVKPFESVNVVGFNAPEWHISNMAAIAVGAKAAGIYTTNGPEACKYITEHSEARVVVVENAKQLEKYLLIRDSLKIGAIIVYDDAVPEGVNVDGKTPVYDWATFMKIGADAGDETGKELAARMHAQKPGHCCTLIYTSGTTGPPKAVMISHDNLTWVTQAFLSLLPPDFGSHDAQGEHVISYLPLSHIAAQTIDIHFQLITGAMRGGKVTVHFAKADAMKGSLLATLQAVRPTLFFGVPRVWEKFAEKLKAKGESNGHVKKMIGGWAKSVGLGRYHNHAFGNSGDDPLLYGLANKLVFHNVRTALGLDRSRFQLTAAAPISKEILEYWGSLDIPILEIYGMSENTGPQNSCSPWVYVPGSCGRPIPGCEIKIDHVADRDNKGEGEICFRGRHIMMGYMKDPERTRETIDPEGFLHSGDVGHVDENGLLFITGRIKELIITAGGENVAPVPVEDRMKAVLPGISNCMMVGDKRKYNTMLICLRQEGKGEVFCDKLIGASLTVNPQVTTVTQAQSDEKWKAYINAGIALVNKDAVSNASKVQKFRILDNDFSVEGGELTGTMKLKRSVVMDKYSAVIDEMYAEAPPSSTPTKKSAKGAAASADSEE
eukprot:gb/GEZN01001620.1/.p1 GENE.gb/GEZN01001620.1/~~gb/GEZN01001620.1/.p1  ORF type:complete len:813 (-),score=86.22 gb/GEZN01001620.1/:290-2728(-)